MGALPNQKLRFHGVQVLRAVAVLLVLWTHMKYSGSFGSVPWVNNGLGVIGVDIFFVISGFVICFNAQSLHYAARDFFINRISRVAPIYWVTAIPLICMYIAKDKTSWNAVTSTFTFLPVFDFGVYTPPTNAFAWTLAYEFWFYATAAVAMRYFGAHWWKALFALFALGTGAVHGFYSGEWLLPYIVFNPFFLEFFYGILIFHLMHRMGRKTLIGASAALAVFIFIYTRNIEIGDYMLTASGGLARALILGGVGATSVIVVVSAERLGWVRWPAVALLIGEASYAIYLLQPYGLSLASKLGERFGTSAWTGATIFLLSSVLAGIVVNALMERRLTKWVRNFLRRVLVPGKKDIPDHYKSA